MNIKRTEEPISICSSKECAPPYGDKSDCEFNQNGVCTAKTLDSDLKLFIDKMGKKKQRSRATKLLPCPVCGKNHKRTLPVKQYFDVQFKVRCLNCGFEIDSFPDKETAHQIWNNLHDVHNKQDTEGKS